jgi:aminoglycoside/choline kinase family phosphotransferase
MRDEAADWIHRHVKNVESIEVAQEWALSTVLRVRTTAGDIFFKSSTRLPLSADEPRLTVLLAQLYPGDVPELIAADLERGWLLLGDVGANLQKQPRFELWHWSLMRLAEIQRDSVLRLDQLLKADCRDGRSARLDSMIDSLLDDDAMLSGLEADEAQKLRALAPRLHQNCRQLERATLVHGDFYSANIGYKDGRLRFFDWSESCIGHPFFDLPVILHDASAYFPPEQVAQLRDDYLACWEDGQRQWQIAAPVAALHHAMMYNGVAEFVNPDKPRLRVSRWLRDVLASA